MNLSSGRNDEKIHYLADISDWMEETKIIDSCRDNDWGPRSNIISDISDYNLI